MRGALCVIHWGLWTQWFLRDNHMREKILQCSWKFGKARLNQRNKYLQCLVAGHSWLALMARRQTCAQTGCNWSQREEKQTNAALKRYLIHKSHFSSECFCGTLVKNNADNCLEGWQPHVCRAKTHLASLIVFYPRLHRSNNGCLCYAKNNMQYLSTSAFIFYCQKIIFRFEWAMQGRFSYLKREFINSIR